MSSLIKGWLVVLLASGAMVPSIAAAHDVHLSLTEQLNLPVNSSSIHRQVQVIPYKTLPNKPASAAIYHIDSSELPREIKTLPFAQKTVPNSTISSFTSPVTNLDNHKTPRSINIFSANAEPVKAKHSMQNAPIYSSDWAHFIPGIKRLSLNSPASSTTTTATGTGHVAASTDALITRNSAGDYLLSSGQVFIATSKNNSVNIVSLVTESRV